MPIFHFLHILDQFISGCKPSNTGRTGGTDPDGIVESLHLLRYSIRLRDCFCFVYEDFRPAVFLLIRIIMKTRCW
ncbi:MAG: hypothetical protein DRH32_08625 [Deltaproteobacteria bacterium]|nr:MAG: hypothetical protein DRH32_08625 [Deltaproteobacteria bacterium]